MADAWLAADGTLVVPARPDTSIGATFAVPGLVSATGTGAIACSAAPGSLVYSLEHAASGAYSCHLRLDDGTERDQAIVVTVF
jgi:hypothetical protein